LIVPTAEECDAIAGAMFDRYAITVRLAAEAGLRQGEILGLRVEDLDLLGRKLTVAGQAQSLPGRGVTLDLPPKSDAGYRTVPLAPATVETVALHLARYPARGGLVVTSSSGAPIRRNMLGDAWAKAKDRSGMGRPLRFHDLRHRYASVLIEGGLDALTVKTLMGHASITETYDTYGHMFPSQSDRAAKAIAAAIHTTSRTVSRTAEGETAGQGA
jgi:integrase